MSVFLFFIIYVGFPIFSDFSFSVFLSLNRGASAETYMGGSIWKLKESLVDL